MICFICTGSTKVVNSRRPNNLQSVWRRRTCVSCGQAFTTRERVDELSIQVMKSNGSIQAFSTAKLFISIYKAALDALEPEVIQQITYNIVDQTLVSYKQPIESKKIAMIAQEALRGINKGAALRYSSFN